MKKYLKLLVAMGTIFSMVFLMVGCSKNSGPKIPILMYHHFDESETSGAVVKKEEFIKQIAYLKENGYNTITVQDLIDYKASKKELPEKPVIITADDGYLSNYEFMYPILKENGMKATIFVIGDAIDNAQKNIDIGYGIPKFNWEQAKEMYESGVISIQSHTYNSHYKAETQNGEVGVLSAPLVDETEEEYKTRIDKDIKDSIEGIQNNLGYKPVALAYPYGEFSDIAEQVLTDNGIEFTVTVRDGMVTSSNKDTHLLNRITVSGEDNIDTFIKKLSK